MVAKAHAGGASFAGAVKYCLGMDRSTLDRERGERSGLECRVVEPSARVEWTEVRNLATTDIWTAARQMAATTQYADELKRLAGGSQAGRAAGQAGVPLHAQLGEGRAAGPGRDEPGR